MDELLSTLNRGTGIFFRNWLGPTGLLLVLGTAARYWWRERERQRSFNSAQAEAFQEGFREGVASVHHAQRSAAPSELRLTQAALDDALRRLRQLEGQPDL